MFHPNVLVGGLVIYLHIAKAYTALIDEWFIETSYIGKDISFEDCLPQY